MTAPILYHYNSSTGEFLQQSVAMRDNFDSLWIIPAFATKEPVPEFKKGFVCIFNEETQIWSYVEDLRGKTFYSKETGVLVHIKDLGSISADLTNIPYPGEFYFWHENNWKLDETKKRDFTIKQNTISRDKLLNSSNTEITVLERKRDRKRATEYELKLLDRIVDYTFDLYDLDLSKEDLVFPPKPE